MTEYDKDNIFARILRGEIPCHKVFEDARTFAFMDIMPRADGHTLVIPKAPSRNVLEMDPDDLAAVAHTVQKVARAALPAFAAKGVVIQQFNGEAAGQVVFHTHFHVIPRREGVAMKPPATVREDDAVLAAHAETLKRHLSG